MMSPEALEEKAKFTEEVESFLKDLLESNKQFFINPSEDVRYDPIEDKHLLCSNFKEPYLAVIERTSGKEVAEVNCDAGRGLYIKSKYPIFDSFAKTIEEKFGKDKCHFVDSRFEYLRAISGPINPRIYIASQEVSNNIGSVSISLPNTVNLQMINKGYQIKGLEPYHNKGYILHLEHNPAIPREKKSRLEESVEEIQCTLPEDITEYTECYLKGFKPKPK